MPKQVKVTFVLPDELLSRMHDAVEAGLAVSASALFREAVSRHLKELQEQQLEKAFREAAADPDFMADIHDTMEAFTFADAEAAARIPEPKPSLRRRASTRGASAV